MTHPTPAEIEARSKAERVWTIQWESKLTGKRGRGATEFSLAEAQAICADANNEFPHLRHWPERADARGERR